MIIIMFLILYQTKPTFLLNCVIYCVLRLFYNLFITIFASNTHYIAQ